ncbi:MAG TPA: hypothetical protein DEA08_23615, partial [Planctomycetes bacterium]|nr:hypothetical protein [Planctomycetota bacterium]
MSYGIPPELLKRIERLPPLHDVARRAAKLLASPRASAQEVSELISSDPVLASRLLSVANSAYYGLPQRVGNLRHAIMLLGFNMVRNLVLTSSVCTSLEESLGAKGDHYRFWYHSIAVAVHCRLVAQAAALPQPEEFFLVGLLHDLGWLALKSWYPEGVAQALEAAARGEELTEVEMDLFETNHAVVGGALLERWKLPTMIVEGVRHHHLPLLSPEPVPAIVAYVSDHLSAIPLPADEEEGGAAEGAEGEASELEDGMPADTAWGVHVSSLDEIDEGLLKRINLEHNKLA